MMRAGAVLFFQFCVLSVLNDTLFLGKFRQQKFKLRDFRGEMKRYDTNFVKMADVLTYKYNRSTPAVNGSFIYKIDIKEDIQVFIQAYKFTSNEYRIFPIHFQVNLCDALESNIAGLKKVFTCGNATDCHFSKNVHYYVCNYFPDSTRFPPNIPNGLFMLEIQLMYKQHELIVMDYYMEVYTPMSSNMDE